MGLDNIPHEYPCIRAGTAILDDSGAIVCPATIAADQCPWAKENARDRGKPVMGMMGAPCWYRGKAGNWMLEELRPVAPLPPSIDEGFYGNVDQEKPGPHLGPDYCNELAQFMEDHAEQYAMLHRNDEDEGRDAIDVYRYAAWWLRFVAEQAEGSDAWW